MQVSVEVIADQRRTLSLECSAEEATQIDLGCVREVVISAACVDVCVDPFSVVVVVATQPGWCPLMCYMVVCSRHSWRLLAPRRGHDRQGVCRLAIRGSVGSDSLELGACIAPCAESAIEGGSVESGLE